MKKTARGFRYKKFKDINGNECVIQKSSLATQDAIWLGSAELKVQHFKAGQGWKPVEYPHTMEEHFVGNERMHLSRSQVKRLLPILQKFVDTGEIN